MAMKLCSRCNFAVQYKRKICEICGNKEFVPAETVVQPIEELSAFNQIHKGCTALFLHLRDDATELMRRYREAARQ